MVAKSREKITTMIRFSSISVETIQNITYFTDAQYYQSVISITYYCVDEVNLSSLAYFRTVAVKISVLAALQKEGV